ISFDGKCRTTNYADDIYSSFDEYTTTNDPNTCIELFFHRLCSNESYRRQFNEDLQKFQNDIKDRAIKINKIIEEKETEKKSSVAGRLDPKIVMESLPEELKECLNARDSAKLQVVLLKMSTKEANDHINRCLRSVKRCNISSSCPRLV
ncbi:unnamed protein product, partial [Rotaria sp. Silwood2]